ncbi:MAG: acyl carrier protein [Desulfobacterales bacterium]|nr:acyl carrier protein [Desulfobacterales bacterium]
MKHKITENEIIKMTNQVFEESFEIETEKLQPKMNIFEDLGLDSLDIVDLIVALQQKFGVKIRNDERVRNIRTLEDVYQFIIILKKEVASLGTGTK